MHPNPGEGEESFREIAVLLSVDAEANGYQVGQGMGQGGEMTNISLRHHPMLFLRQPSEGFKSVCVDPESLESFDLRV